MSFQSLNAVHIKYSSEIQAPLFSNGKINIGLHVGSERDDGYHNIESVFYPIAINDVLEWKVSKSFSLKIYGTPEKARLLKNNILETAWRYLHNTYGIPPVEIHLLKNIPAGSGLGGGSSDASIFLKSVNETFHLGLNNESLEAISLLWGSDCPFFIKNRPAFAAGRGEQLLLLPGFLQGYRFVVVYTEPVNTAGAFSMIKPRNHQKSHLSIIPESSVEQWKDFVFNDFEPVIFKRHPALRAIKKLLYKNGALYASMSGTGSAIYGIFSKDYEFRTLETKQFGKATVFTGTFI